jgi:CRISPR-associated protein Csb2
MLAIRIHLLTGRYVATAFNDRGRAEWPPHPARLFSALVATHHSRSTPAPAERAALEWLEAQGPPEIRASEAHHRRVMQHFVPVNDTSVHPLPDRAFASIEQAESHLQNLGSASDTAQRGAEARGSAKALRQAENALQKARVKLEHDTAKAALPGSRGGTAQAAAELLPDHRKLQPRTFPSVTPHDDQVWLSWPQAQPDQEIRAALGALVADVVSLGHSSSLVAMALCDDPPSPSLVPVDLGPRSLRVPGPGQLAALEAEFLRHRGVEPRLLPALQQAYAPPSQPQRAISSSVFGDDWIVLARVGGPRLPSARAADVAGAARAALMKYSDDPVPAFISGHGPASEALRVAHLAFVPLPFIGAPRSDGAILGLALVIPRDVEPKQRRDLARALLTWERSSADGTLRLTLGRAGVLELQRLVDLPRLHTLRPSTWCHSARRWATATPVALDRNPGQLRHRDPDKAARAAVQAAEIIATAAVHIGLPRPVVHVIPAPRLGGARKAQDFPGFPAGAGKLQRVLTHAVLDFPEPVAGPVVIGAGRYRGLGLCRPVVEE